MDKCIVDQLHTVLPDDVTALVDANPDVQLRVRRGIRDANGRVLEGAEASIFNGLAGDREVFVAHAWQPVSKFTVSALRLADVSLYTEFSIPRLHVSTAINATRFNVALDAEVNNGVFRDVKLNDDWVPGETLLLDNNMLTCQLLIPQITALIDILWTLMNNTPRTAQYALSFAHALRDYQLAKYRK